jgi:phospholipid/cholesterol/gamma-HCH transport system substrate-binding protein
VSRRPLVLLLAMALLASGCALMPGNGGYTLTAEFSRSYNLFPGSPVRVAGIEVGTIADVAVPEGATHVEVELRIDEGREIPEDTTAIVVTETLSGERYVQLPPDEGGPALEDGAVIPEDRTLVPYEFDEVLENLNQFVGGLEEDEVGRFVGNLAEVLDGQGDQLGRTIDQAHEAIGVLKDNDEELIALASRLADLNATLATRDEQLGQVIQDFDTLATSLVDDRTDIDAALSGLVRVTDQLARLLETNRDRLEQDIATLTRVGRTAQRNLDYLSLGILSSAELFRHAERAIDRDRNMLPLQNQTEALIPQLTDSVVFRLQGVCLAAGLPEDECTAELIEDLIGGLVCAPPIVPCRGEDGEDAIPLEEAVGNLVAADAEMSQALAEHLAAQQDRLEERRAEQQDAPEDEEPADEPAPDEEPDEPEDDDDGGLTDELLGMEARR